MMVIVISKLIGMLRDVVLANYFGTTNISDAYLIASSVPVLLFYFIGHSLSTAYIPMYNKVKVKSGEQSAVYFSNNILNTALILSTFIVIILLLFPNLVIKLFAAGFDYETASIAARLIRISAPSIYLMCIVHICGGYLQANKSFLAPAAISLPRNAAIVVSVILAASLGTDILGWGLLVSYFLEFLFLLPFVLKTGYRYRPVLNIKDEELKHTFYIVMPILLGVCVSQINKIIDRSIASTVVVGGVSALSYASIVNNAVQEVLVTGIITILFSSCAELVAKGEHERIANKLSSTVNTMIFLLVPASVGIVVLSEPIVKLLLSRGSFDENSIAMTTGALSCYTVGLVFLAVRDTLVKVFYAYKETKITTITSVIAILINIILNILLSVFMGINGLALATSISAAVHCIVLYILLRKKIGDFGLKGLMFTLVKALISSGVMLLTLRLVQNALSGGTLHEFVALLLSVLIGAAVYFACSFILYFRVVISKLKIKKKQA